MLYRELIAVCSEIHTKHTNTLCRQKAELWNVKLVVHIVTARISVLVFLQLPMTKHTIADYLQFFLKINCRHSQIIKFFFPYRTSISFP
jgi:hypothetical protein